MRCLCLGICHIKGITEILRNTKSFTSIYDDIISHAVYEITPDQMKDILENIAPTADLIISQPISDKYRNVDVFATTTLKRYIKKDARHIIIPNCYFTGYDPKPYQLRDSSDQTVSVNGISYIPYHCLNELLAGDITKAVEKWNHPDLIDDLAIKNNYLSTIGELKSREFKIFDTNYGVDITISDFIENNYKEKLLFHTYNHPTNILLFELTKRILIRLGISTSDIGTGINRELIGDYGIPPVPCLYNKLGMTFKYPKFIIDRKEYTTRDAFDIFSQTIRQKDHL